MTERRPPSAATVAIVGAGFSGLLTAIRLLGDPEGPKVRLVERRAAFARGAAYSTEDAGHLLNVRAANMSAFPEAPTHFCDWLAAQGAREAEAESDRHAFVSRRQYGDYLQAMLRAAAEKSAAGRLILEADEAVALEKEGAGWRVTLGMGRSIQADAVVLATGNLPPSAPAAFAQEVTAAPGYITDPWSIAPETLPETGSALLIGTGLTMIDVALHLSRLRPDWGLTTLSRRGLLPRRHLAEGPQPLPWELPSDRRELTTARAILAEMKRRARTHDWRAVIDGVRPHVRSIWKSWPQGERARFLRHARPWWDVHRHRLAPAVASQLDHLMGSAQLTVQAGSITDVRLTESGFKVSWTARGERTIQAMQVAVVVNCTGPTGDLTRCGDPLLQHLLQRGLVRADAGQLGLDVDDDNRLIDGSGHESESLFAVGPITRGAFWEITSVPDIRVQAADCATTLSAQLQAQAWTPVNSPS